MQRFREILVLAPAEPDTPEVIARAAELAARNQARLTIFDVVPALGSRRSYADYGGTSIDLQQLLVDARLRELEEAASRVLTVDTRVAVGVGVRFVSVVERVLEFGHDLVITAPDQAKGTRGLSGATTTLHLLRKCPVPVWVNDPRTWGNPDVVVAVGPFREDGEIGDLNQMLVELGTSLARMQGGEVHLVHAWRLDGESLLRTGRARLRPEVVDDLVDDERIAAEKAFAHLLDNVDADGLTVHSHLRRGDPATVVGNVVEEAQPGVIVMGTLARTGLPGLIIGNTAERMLGGVEGSVLAVKPPGFVSPVAGS